jgi:hypothetical protein
MSKNNGENNAREIGSQTSTKYCRNIDICGTEILKLTERK